MAEQENEIIKLDPGFLRKYIYEIALIALASAVVTLFLMFNDLNKFIRDSLIQDRTRLEITVENNTKAINEFLIHQKDKQQ